MKHVDFLSNKKQHTDASTPASWTFKDIIHFCGRWLFMERAEANFSTTACRLLNKQRCGAPHEKGLLFKKNKQKKTYVVGAEEGNNSTLPPLEKH